MSSITGHHLSKHDDPLSFDLDFLAALIEEHIAEAVPVERLAVISHHEASSKECSIMRYASTRCIYVPN